jgi:hypothetical protein
MPGAAGRPADLVVAFRPPLNPPPAPCQPPKDRRVRTRVPGGWQGVGGGVRQARRTAGRKGNRNGSLGLAMTRSPTLRRAVPWARRGFTAGFGMEPGGSHAL